MKAGAPYGNKNAEIWTIEESKILFQKAIELSKQDDYDFIGEIARELDTYRDIFTFLSDKYDELKPLYNRILSNLEANCFSHSKSGKIKEATAIVNLKSNYRWTDRTQTEHSGEIKTTDLSKMPTDELIKRAAALEKLENEP